MHGHPPISACSKELAIARKLSAHVVSERFARFRQVWLIASCGILYVAGVAAARQSQSIVFGFKKSLRFFKR
jgi:hypothetical protein